MSQIDRAFLTSAGFDRALADPAPSDALVFWQEQERRPLPPQALDDATQRMPSGWWMLPAFLAGAGIWAMILRWIFW